MVGNSSEQESWVSSKPLVNEEEEQQIAETYVKDSNLNQDEGVFDLETEEIWKKVNQSTKNNNINRSNINRSISSYSSSSINRSSINRSSSSRINRSSFNSSSRSNSKKKKNQVLLEGYVEVSNNENEDDLWRTKSLTDDDLDELKGCLDLGFGFSYDEIPELCNTLPALELCYSMSQKFLDEQNKSPERSSPTAAEAAASGPIANWKISSPGDHPEDVKARLKFWAQAVACTVRLCN